jgi:hypothetical protein
MKRGRNEREFPTHRGDWPVPQPARSKSLPGERRERDRSLEAALELAEARRYWQAFQRYLREKLARKEQQ